MITVAESILLGFCGAITFILIQMRHHGLEYVREKAGEFVAYLLWGFVGGYLGYVLITYHGWANHLTVYLIGLSGPTFAEGLRKRGG